MFDTLCRRESSGDCNTVPRHLREHPKTQNFSAVFPNSPDAICHLNHMCNPVQIGYLYMLFVPIDIRWPDHPHRKYLNCPPVRNPVRRVAMECGPSRWKPELASRLATHKRNCQSAIPSRPTDPDWACEFLDCPHSPSPNIPDRLLK